MVQLKSYYSLCPLIDKLSFLGVCEDRQQGLAIVTLGKNVVNIYKLSDQKQVGGWTSKEHLTAPVVYDSQEKDYVGVFSENVIKTWKPDVQSLDKLKKKKFSKPIWKIIKDIEGKCTVVFKDGDSASLVYAIEARKNLEPLSIVNKTETIVNASLFTLQERNYMCYMLKSGNDYTILSFELNVDVNSPMLDTAKRIEIARSELVGGRIIGVTISSRAEPPQAHVLWSDGRLFANNLREDDLKLVGHVPWICHSLDVSMAWIGGKHIAIYGADNGQEGAVLAVYNILFGVGTCSHPLKLFCKGARLWCVWDYILLEATQHLAVVPFMLYTHRNMLALIGSQKDEKNEREILIADWGKGKKNWKSKESWNDMAVRGMSEREICLSYFPTLIEENKMHAIKKSLDRFTDVPENIIVTLLSYVVHKLNPNDSLKNVKENLSGELNVDNLELRGLLNTILALPYVKEYMVSALRKILALKDMLYLLQYINYILSSNSEDGNVDFEDKLINWSVVLIDSHYQQLVLSNDVDTREILLGLECCVTDAIDDVQEMQTVLPLFNSLLRAKNYDKSNVEETSSYYIEEITIGGLK